MTHSTHTPTTDVPQTGRTAQQIKEGWTHEARINRLLALSTDGERPDDMPKTPEEALALMKQRFGAVYPALSPALQRDPTIAAEAIAQSMGHAARFMPTMTAAQADAIIQALRSGEMNEALLLVCERNMNAIITERRHAASEVLCPNCGAIVSDPAVKYCGRVNCT